MNNRLTAGALTCVLALSAAAQTPAPFGITLHDRHTKSLYRLVPDSRNTFDLVPTTDGHGAVRGAVYGTPSGQRCEIFVADGQLMAAQAPHRWLLHDSRPKIGSTGLLLPDGHGGRVVIPVPADCPKL